MRKLHLVLFALFFSATHFLFAQQNRAGDTVVATVGAKKITLDDFNKKYNEVSAQAIINKPTKELFLEDLVRYEVGLQEAKKKGLEKDPYVQERFNQELYKIYLERELGKRVENIKTSDAEMRAWYAKNPAIRTSHILIEFKVDATPQQKAEAKKRAEEILAKVKDSKRPFEENVRLYTDDPASKQTGGDIGWQSRVNLVPNYYNTVLQMKIGEVRGLIETPYGFHIVKLTGRQSYEETDLRMVRASVFDEKRKVIFDSFFDGLKKNISVKSNPSLLN